MHDLSVVSSRNGLLLYHLSYVRRARPGSYEIRFRWRTLTDGRRVNRVNTQTHVVEGGRVPRSGGTTSTSVESTMGPTKKRYREFTGTPVRVKIDSSVGVEVCK